MSLWRKKHLAIPMIALVVVGAAAGIGLASNRTAHRTALNPPAFAALADAKTRVSSFPTWAHAADPNYKPNDAAVHEFGRGQAVAWVSHGRTCWSTPRT